MAFRFALTTLLVAALCSSSMASSLRMLRAAAPGPVQNQVGQVKPVVYKSVASPAPYQAVAVNAVQQPQAKSIVVQAQPIIQPQPVYQAAQPSPVAAKSAFSAGSVSNGVPNEQAQVTGQSYDYNPVDHSYSYSFQTNNGISQQAKGYINPNGNYVQEGSYTLYSPEGVPVSISYIADENGYQAVGDAIPQPDPVIARAVAYLRSLPPSSEEKKQ